MAVVCAREKQACCCDAGGDDAEEVLFVSAGGLVSRILVSAITTQSRTAKGIAMLNLQVSSKTIRVCTGCFDHVDVNESLSTGISAETTCLRPSLCVCRTGWRRSADCYTAADIGNALKLILRTTADCCIGVNDWDRLRRCSCLPMRSQQLPAQGNIIGASGIDIGTNFVEAEPGCSTGSASCISLGFCAGE